MSRVIGSTVFQQIRTFQSFTDQKVYSRHFGKWWITQHHIIDLISYSELDHDEVEKRWSDYL